MLRAAHAMRGELHRYLQTCSVEMIEVATRSRREETISQVFYEPGAAQPGQYALSALATRSSHAKPHFGAHSSRSHLASAFFN